MKDHTDFPIRAQRLRQPVQNLRTHLCVQRVLVERYERHAPIPDPLEFGVDAAHRPSSVPMDDAEVESVLGKLVSARESKPTRSPENQCPFMRRKRFFRHFSVLFCGHQGRAFRSRMDRAFPLGIAPEPAYLPGHKNTQGERP